MYSLCNIINSEIIDAIIERSNGRLIMYSLCNIINSEIIDAIIERSNGRLIMYSDLRKILDDTAYFLRRLKKLNPDFNKNP
jgi:hypothetical protein